ncbi:hypothetical protein ACFL52_02640 [Candidatus Margulisiibacteriota bacterium]
MENLLKYLKIDELEIIPLRPQKGRIAVISFVLNGALKISNISIYTRPQGGFRLVYPTKMMPTGYEEACFKPITREMAQVFDEVLIESYKAFIMDKAIEDDIKESVLNN